MASKEGNHPHHDNAHSTEGTQVCYNDLNSFPNFCRGDNTSQPYHDTKPFPHDSAPLSNAYLLDQGQEHPQPMFGKIILLMCGSITFGISLSLPICLSAMFLEWQEAFDVTRAHTAAVHSTCIGIIFSGGVISGGLMDKFGARTTCLLGSFVASLGLFLGFFATSIDYLIVTTGVLTGSGFCLLQLPCIPCISQPFKKYRSLSISICSFGVAALNMVFPHVFRLLVEHYSWRGAYLIISGIALHTCVTSLVMTSTTRGKKLKAPSPPCQESLLRDGSGELRFESRTPEDTGGSNSEMIVMLNSKEEIRGSCHLSNDVAHIKEMKTQNQLKISGHFRSIISQLTSYFKSSDWKFLRVPMFLLYLLCLAVTLGSLFACYVLLMDVARTKNFDRSIGAMFILTTALANLGGRVIVCFLNLWQRLHSFVILCLFGGAGSIAMLTLGYLQELPGIIISLVIIGAAIGGMVSVYPKCALDISTACGGSYPLALGMTCTSEGIFDFILPVVIGYMVDLSNDYILPLSVLGCLSFLMMSVLLIAFGVQQCRQRKSLN